MLSHILLPSRTSVKAPLAALALSLLIGCAASRPEVHVIGVAPAAERQGDPASDRVVVFLEVVNRTGRELELSRFEYRLSAPSWFAAEGNLALRRHVDADSSAVVEIPVAIAGAHAAEAALDEDVPYQLEGRIVAREDHVERSWAVESSGRLRAPEKGVNAGRVRVRVATGDP